MKIYEIINEYENMSVGTLLYYEKNNDFIIELKDTLDEWNAPMLLSAFVKRNEYTILRDISRIWALERVVPSGRQNINSILSNHKIKAYDEMKLLEVAEGRCSQDDLAIKKLIELPSYVKERMKRNVVECVVTEEKNVLVFFADDTMRKIAISEFSDLEGVDSVLANDKLLYSCKVGTGGYFITFNDSIDISANMLYSAGDLIPLTLSDVMSFLRNNVLDTTESCSVLECSRQNLAYMVKQEQLSPVKAEVKGNLYLKGEVIKNTW